MAASSFRFAVIVTVERTEGKFASREEVAGQLVEALEHANPEEVSGIGSDGTTTYEVIEWDISTEES